MDPAVTYGSYLHVDELLALQQPQLFRVSLFASFLVQGQTLEPFFDNKQISAVADMMIIRDEATKAERLIDLDLAVKAQGEKVATRDFRKHLLWYTKGLRGGAQLRQRLGQIHDRETALMLLENYFQTIEMSA